MSAGPGRPGDPPLVRLRLDISYDGTDFTGWAVQPGRRTVAGVLATALTVLFRDEVAMVVAGRTDAGVHATGQVAHIDVDPDRLAGLTPRNAGPSIIAPVPRSSGREALIAGCVGLVRRLAGLLPPDVRVRAVRVAPAGFDARFSALRRHYRYRIGIAEWGSDPLRRNDVWSHRRPLDVAAMNAAALAVLGLHDFAAFCRPRPGGTTIRELQSLTAEQRAETVQIRASADAFCHSMVRALVGALVAVGDGRADVAAPAHWLAVGLRTASFQVAPARGLTLAGVDYPDDRELAARAAATRAVRRSGWPGPAAAVT